MTNNLVIVGNGMDLHAGLKSRYEDFFKTAYLNDIYKPLLDAITLRESNNIYNQIIKHLTNNDINAWDIIFILNHIEYKKEDYNWFEIEKLIKYQILNQNSYLNRSYSYVMNSKNLQSSFNLPNIKSVVNKLDFEYYYVLTYFIEKTKGSFNDLIDMSDYFLKELNKFEARFSTYIYSIITSSFNQKLSNLFDTFYMNKVKFNVLSFNYTDYSHIDSIEKINYIHGQCKNNIIFGIDSMDIKFYSHQYRFTKTYRILEQYVKLRIENFNQTVLTKQIKNIFFLRTFIG